VDREARVIVVEERHHAAHRVAVEQFGIDAVQAHRIAAPGEGVALLVGVIEIEHAALAHHRVVIEALLQPLPQLHRPFVEALVARQQIVRADDGGVPPGIAGADVALLQHRHVGDAVLAREVIRGREPVAAAADDHDIVLGLRLGLAPRRGPAGVAAKSFSQQRKDGVFHLEPAAFAAA
jgi:hypothetical protein